jgi:membrane associated rhomboid family serine protease
VRRALRIDGVAWVMLAGLLCLGAVVVTAISAERGALPAGAALARALDWQPALGLSEPWRLWTCAWVHWSAAHLGVNVAGGLVVAFVGWRARMPAVATATWFAAWPLTQLLMAALGNDRLGSVMAHYAGLSGVLHAGVIVMGLSLAWPLVRPRIRRTPGAGGAPSRMDTGFVASRASMIEPSRITEGPWAMTGLEELGAQTGLPVSTLDQAPFEVDTAPALRMRWIGVAIVAGTLMKVVFEAPWELAPRPSAVLGTPVATIAHACGAAAGLLAWVGARIAARRHRRR